MSQSPCAWVRDRIEAGAFFSLLARRVYMVLFSSFSAFGLEADDDDRSDQLSSISDLSRQPKFSEGVVEAIECLIAPDHSVSIDVGLSRLLGQGGVLSVLDPVREGQGRELEQRWDLAPDQAEGMEQPLISSLEEKCFEIWAEMENGLENYGVRTVSTYRYLRRWITSVTYRIGFFSEGKMLFEEDLKELDEILASDVGDNSTDQELLLEKISEQLAEMLAITDEGIEIGPFVNITGRWVGRTLEVQLTGDESESGGLGATVGEKKFEVSALVYAWLKRRARMGLSKETFPGEILQIAEDIRRSAATSSGYAFARNGISLHIRLPGKRNDLILKRVNNHVVVSPGQE